MIGQALSDSAGYFSRGGPMQKKMQKTQPFADVIWDTETWPLPELANTIDSGIDIGYFGGIDIDIGIDKRPLQLLVLILVLIRGLPELLAILFIKENTVITASRQRQPTFPSVFLLSLPA